MERWLAALGVVGVLGLAAYAWYASRSKAPKQTFQVRTSGANENYFGLSLYYLPEGFELGKGYEVVVVDESNRVLKSTTSAKDYAISTIIPKGFTADTDLAKVQIRKSGNTVAEALFYAPPIKNSFQTSPHPHVEAWIDKSQLVVRYRDPTVGIGDLLAIAPKRTDCFTYGEQTEFPMKLVAPGVFEASIHQHYPENVSRFNFEIRHVKFQPDELTINGAMLLRKNGKPAIVIPEQMTSTKNGRRISFSKQELTPQTTVFWVRGEVIGGYHSPNRAGIRMLSPSPGSLGVEDVFFLFQWGSIPIVTQGIGKGPAWEDPKHVPDLNFKEGLIGPMKLRMYLSDFPKLYVHKFAVPVAPKPPDLKDKPVLK